MNEIEEIENKIDYLDSIISTLEDLQSLYYKDSDFKKWYEDTQKEIDFLEEQRRELEQEKAELEEKEYRESEEELIGMNAEFERSRL
ncbi:MAG: hypothetical protein U0L22_08160 [Bacteroidales bacterium]|nr:hypothetical protein [Bacteroidales bacterium]